MCHHHSMFFPSHLHSVRKIIPRPRHSSSRRHPRTNTIAQHNPKWSASQKSTETRHRNLETEIHRNHGVQRRDQSFEPDFWRASFGVPPPCCVLRPPDLGDWEGDAARSSTPLAT